MWRDRAFPAGKPKGPIILLLGLLSGSSVGKRLTPPPAKGYSGGERYSYEGPAGGRQVHHSRTRVATIPPLVLISEVDKSAKPDGDDSDDTTEIKPTAESEV